MRSCANRINVESSKRIVLNKIFSFKDFKLYLKIEKSKGCHPDFKKRKIEQLDRIDEVTEERRSVAENCGLHDFMR